MSKRTNSRQIKANSQVNFSVLQKENEYQDYLINLKKERLRTFRNLVRFTNSLSLEPGEDHASTFCKTIQLASVLQRALELLNHSNVYKLFQHYRQKFEIIEIHSREQLLQEASQRLLEIFNLTTTKDQIEKNKQNLYKKLNELCKLLDRQF
ncbi:hypothetical protein F8M41_007956 [Gigaspora margarita]|uniref:Uncharacterized protein n=1 Tax=Gigaspora margarita TaxID=4874 RepID=A0A8H4A4Y1_GIGMA|nr:hypothetical protein F8M41_007956 [Gigaspora margarita]